jgi:hypothetical protein
VETLSLQQELDKYKQIVNQIKTDVLGLPQMADFDVLSSLLAMKQE